MGKQQKTPDRIPGCVGALGGADSLSATRAITGTGSLGEDRLQRGPGRPTCCPARGGGGAGGQGGGGGGVAAAPDSEEGGGGDGTENKQEGTGKLVDGDPPSVITGRTRVLTLPREVRARPRLRVGDASAGGGTRPTAPSRVLSLLRVSPRSVSPAHTVSAQPHDRGLGGCLGPGPTSRP